MKARQSSSAFAHIPRRTFLAGVGTTAAGTLLRPLFASAAGASPTRLLIVHRPCGTYPTDFFPQTGDATTFTLPPILQPFAPVKDAMTILNGIYCPRDHGWAGDQHGAGLITMMSGKRPIEIPGTSSGGDPNAKNQQAAGPSFDQMMIKTAGSGLGGTSVPSIQSTAYRPSSIGLPNFKVMSYDTAGALFPESRPDTLFGNIFAASMPGLSAADLDRLRAQNKSILDFVSKDLTRLRGLVPKSQLPKLDAHLDGLTTLEAKLTAAPSGGGAGGAACTGPTQATPPAQTGDLTIDEAQHQVIAQNQLAIILAAFQCDLTRVATFSFAHGNSALRFAKIIPGFDDPARHGPPRPVARDDRDEPALADRSVLRAAARRGAAGHEDHARRRRHAARPHARRLLQRVLLRLVALDREHAPADVRREEPQAPDGPPPQVRHALHERRLGGDRRRPWACP